MKLEIGIVADTRDLTKTGMIKIEHPSFQGNIMAKYTSPYMGTKGSGGFVGIPEVGSRVLIVQPDSSEEWFYMSTIVDYKQTINSVADNPIKDMHEVLPEKRLYAYRGLPTIVGMYSQKGHALRLSDSYNPGMIAVKAELKSSLGKRITLNDSPGADNIVIRNEHGDGIRITTGSNPAMPARSIELESAGPQKLICRESQMDLWVYDGRELNIMNESTGFNSSPLDPDRYGNINISSKNRDINLTVRSDDGRIFIDALGSQGVIQIDTDGVVRIAARDIELIANNNISFQAGNNINLKANNAIAMEGTGTISMLSSGNISADGALIFLNSGVSTPVAINLQKIDNYYGD